MNESQVKKVKPFLSVTIPEQPIAMQRPRLGHGHTYNPQATEKERLGWLFKEAMMHAHKNCTDKPLTVHLVFHFKRVKSNKRKHHTSTPDLDNCIKFALDAMQGDGGIIYFNDSQIVELRASKCYSNEPHTDIVICEI